MTAQQEPVAGIAASAPHVDTSPIYKALIEARLALLAVNSFASQVAIGLIDKVLNAAPDDASAPALHEPAQLPESMSRDEMLKYYSEYANVRCNEALRYQKRIRELEAALATHERAAPALKNLNIAKEWLAEKLDKHGDDSDAAAGQANPQAPCKTYPGCNGGNCLGCGERAAPAPEHLTITTDREGRCVLVSWQDDEHQVLRIVWEAEGPYTPHESTRSQPVAAEGVRDAQDAARYRCLRRGQHWSVIDGIGDTLRAEVLDAAIDAALSESDE